MSGPVAARIARTETRRTLRVFTGDRAKIALMALVGLVGFGPMTAAGLFFLPSLGEAVAAGDVSGFGGVSVRAVVTGVTALAWLGVVAMATMRTVTTRGDVDEPACLLLATSTRSAVAGLIGTELLLLSLWFVPVLALLAGAFSYGAGSILPLVIVLGVLAGIFVTAIPVGFVVGLAIRHVLTTYEPIARFKTPLFVLVGVAYVGAIATGGFNRLVVVLFETVGRSPLGWPGEFLLFAVPGHAPRPLVLAGSTILVAVVSSVALGAGTRLANRHWFADEVRTDEGREVRSSNRLDAALAAIDDRALRAVTVTTIRRAKRAPVKLLYVAYPLFGVVAFVEDIVATGTVDTFVATALCAYVVWASGALLTLNVVGDHGRTLPAILTTPASGRQVVGGTVLAGALVVGPVALLASAALGLVSPLSGRAVGLLVAGTVVGSVAAAALATGVGALFPRFGSVRISSNREAVMPSKSAFVTYTLALAVPAAAAGLLYADAAEPVAGAVSALGSLAPVIDVTVGAGAITAIAWLVVGLGAIGPFASVAYASRRFDRFELD